MNTKPGCGTCGGTGRVWVNQIHRIPCYECLRWKHRRAYLAQAFGGAVIWIPVYQHSYWDHSTNAVPYFTNEASRCDFNWIIEDKGLWLGIDGTGNLVELIDHEGNMFNVNEWLSQ
jgi:hypothetical protein